MLQRYEKFSIRYEDIASTIMHSYQYTTIAFLILFPFPHGDQIMADEGNHTN